MEDKKNLVRKKTLEITVEDTDITKRLKRLRAYANMTQAEFARKYDIPPSTYAKWENGDREPAGYVVSLLEKVVDPDGNIE